MSIHIPSSRWLILFICVVLVGCHTTSQPEHPAEIPAATKPAPVAQPAVSETSDGNYFVNYISQPSPIPLNEMFALEVNVFRDAKLQQPAAGTTIEVDAGMPAHHHGMNLSARIEPVSDGRFRVSGMLFHMPGQWEIYIDVIQGAKKERARFAVEVR